MAAGATSTKAAEGGGDPALRVFRASTSQLLVGPIRLVLGCALVAVGLGASRAAAGVSFLVGTFAALADPRRRFLAIEGEPQPLPAAAARGRRPRAAARARAPVAALISGLELRLSERERGRQILVDRRARRPYDR